MTTSTDTKYHYGKIADAKVSEVIFNRYSRKIAVEAMLNLLRNHLPMELDTRGIYELRITIKSSVEPVAGGYHDIHFGLHFSSELLIGFTTDSHPELATSPTFIDTDKGDRVYSLHLAHLDGWTLLDDDELLDHVI